MAKIILTRGYFAEVDNDDYILQSKHKWHALVVKGKVYAIRKSKKSDMLPKRTSILMHRAILGVKDITILIDHIDNDGLNNKRNNLRKADASTNQMNLPIRKNRGSSKYKGVDWHKRSSKWRANIRKNGVTIYLGLYSKETDAALAYNNKAKEIFGEFALLNKITL